MSKSLVLCVVLLMTLPGASLAGEIECEQFASMFKNATDASYVQLIDRTAGKTSAWSDIEQDLTAKALECYQQGIWPWVFSSDEAFLEEFAQVAQRIRDAVQDSNLTAGSQLQSNEDLGKIEAVLASGGPFTNDQIDELQALVRRAEEGLSISDDVVASATRLTDLSNQVLMLQMQRDAEASEVARRAAMADVEAKIRAEASAKGKLLADALAAAGQSQASNVLALGFPREWLEAPVSFFVFADTDGTNGRQGNFAQFLAVTLYAGEVAGWRLSPTRDWLGNPTGIEINAPGRRRVAIELLLENGTLWDVSVEMNGQELVTPESYGLAFAVGSGILAVMQEHFRTGEKVDWPLW